MTQQKNFVVYRASAGSGKTFTLVKEYLTLALDGDDTAVRSNFRHILAITFTNKATNEMKERILATLSRLKDPAMRDDKEKSMRDALCTALGNISHDELSRRAAILQKAILHNYSDFSVCTIDSFMNRIVRTFAVDLGLSPRFEISMDKDTVLDAAVDKLFADISEERPDLTRVMLQFARSKMEDGKYFNVYRDVRKASDNILKENILEKLSEMQNVTLQQFCDYADSLRERIREYEKEVLKIAADIVSTAAKYSFSDTDFNGKSRGALSYFTKVNSTEVFCVPTDTVLKYVNGDNIFNASGLRKAHSSEIDRAIKDGITQIVQGYPVYCSCKALMLNTFQVALLKDIKDKLDEYYHESEVLHISENNKRVSEEVKNEDAPFIFERLGCRYKHFLIDEFQDTSIMQWHNLLPLVVNGLSEGHRSLIVGDGKQAIYRFRQGDVEQFQNITTPPANATQTIRNHYDTLERNCKIVELGTNYRSAGNIVEFNNRFFTFLEKKLQQLSPNDLMHNIFVGSDDTNPSLVQNVAPDKQGKGYVEVDLIEKSHLAEDAPRRIYDLLCHLCQVGYKYKDVAILARTNRKLSELNLQLMAINGDEHKLQGLQFASAESLKLSQNADCKFMRALMRYVHDSNNDIAKLEIAEHLFGKGYTAFDSSIFATKGNFDKVFATTFADYDRDRLLSQTLYDCGCNLVRIFGIPQTPYIYTFLNKIEEYTEHNRTDLGNFLEWLNDCWEKLSTVTSDDLDAVRLMSVHKSKGLEFDVVIYYMDNTKDHKESLWVDVDNNSIGINSPDLEQIKVGMVTIKKELADTKFGSEYATEKIKRDIDKLNIVYVAMTRPKNQLYVVAETANKKEEKNGKKESPKSATSHTELLEAYVSADGSGFSKSIIKNSEETEIGARYCLGDSSYIPNQQQNAMPLESNATQPWADRIRIVGRSDSIMQQQSEQQQVGNIVHEILSTVGTLDNAGDAVEKWLAEHKLGNDVAEKVKALMDSVLNSDAVKPFFNPDNAYKTECDILCGGEIVRPDRIVFAGDETWVVDYKTGSHKEKYEDQVRGYMSVLEKMGYENVKGFLLYISGEGCYVEKVG